MKKLIALMLVLLAVLVIPVTSVKAEEEKNIKVAIIDSGIDENNPLLDYSRIAPGKSYIEEISSCDDKIGHGTAIAGIIQSYAPDAYLVPLMYYSRRPSGVPANGGIEAICEAIYDAVDIYDCKIINISSGIYAENDELESAIAYAETKNVIVISAVGNDMLSDSKRVFYPAAYDTVIGVGAIDSDLNIASFSQQNDSVTTVAYGVGIKVLSIKNNLEYTMVSGTSYSAAAFCGLVAKYIVELYMVRGSLPLSLPIVIAYCHYLLSLSLPIVFTYYLSSITYYLLLIVIVYCQGDGSVAELFP